jgi:acyl-CoA oxidase
VAELGFDTKALQDLLDGRWAEVREQSREMLRQPLFHPLAGLGTEEHRERVLAQVTELAEGPGPKLGFPSKYGGGDDIGGSVVSFETMAQGDLSLLVKIGVQFGLFGGAILHLGTERHHEAYLSDIMTMRLAGCFGMTETGHGSDVQAIRTTATYDVDRGDFVLHTPDEDARKDYIGNAARDGRMAVVFAQLSTRGESHGVHAFVLPIRDEQGKPCPGVSIEDCGHKAGLNGVDNGRLSFDDVRVDRNGLLDRYADVAEDGTYTSPIADETKRFFTMVGTLIQGRVSVAGGALGATKTAQTIAVRYAEARRQFSPPDSDDEVVIFDFLQHQRRLLPDLARTYALHFAQEQLVADLDEAFGNAGTEPDPDEDRRELEARAAGIKALSTWHATSAIQTCREACGGAGYLSENRLPAIKADTDVFTTFEGDNTVLLQLVAKGLLTNYRDQFGDLGRFGLARFVADQVKETVFERTTARQLIQRLVDSVPGREEETDLLDRGYHLALFEWREKHVLDGLGRRMRAGVSAGSDTFDVFNDSQDHVLLAARVHMERVVLEAFVAAIDRCEDETLVPVLDALCSLYALAEVERDKGWFLEHGRLSPGRSKAVTAAVNDLCRALRPHARALVDAFAVPEETIAAPIALGAEARRQERPGSDEALSPTTAVAGQTP